MSDRRAFLRSLTVAPLIGTGTMGVDASKTGPADGKMSEAELAALEFEVWQADSEFEEFLSCKGMNNHFINLRLAWATMLKTKGELVALIESFDTEDDADAEAALAFITGVGDTGDLFEKLTGMLKSAELRLHIASAVYLERIAA